MPKKEPIPPRFATRLLRVFLRDDLQEDVIGDLREGYECDVHERGNFSAKLKYWRQVLNYLRPFAIKRFKTSTSNPSDMYKSYFRTAIQNMVKNKLHAFINIAGLAIGMAVALIIGLWIHDEVSFNKQFSNHDRIGQVIQNVTNNGQVETWWSVPWPLGDELRQNYGSGFKYLSMCSYDFDHTITVGGEKFTKTGLYAEPDFQGMFGVEVVNGSFDKSDPSTILLSSSAALAFFGNEDPIGKTFEMDGASFKVSGVYNDLPKHSRWSEIQFLAHWEKYKILNGLEQMQEPWRPNGSQLFAMLADHATFEEASIRIKDAKLKKLNEALAKKKPELFLHPMGDWHLRSEFSSGKKTGGLITYVWMFGIVGSFVLLMACINFMNLSTARSEKRAKEVGIRKAVGSYRSQLITQFFSESVLTAFISLMLAAGVTHIALPIFNSMAEKNMSLPWGSPYMWIGIVAGSIVIGIIAGSYPALYLSAIRPAGALKGVHKAGRGASLPRKVLVIAQFTVSVVMIIGTTTVFLQIQHGRNRSLGYNVSGLVAIPRLTQEVHNHFDVIKKDLVDKGAIVSMTEAGAPSTSAMGSSSRFDWDGKDPDLSIDFNVFFGSVDYGNTIQWDMLQGRDFSREFPSDSLAVILNETAAGYLGKKDIVGETFRSDGQPFTIVGVVRNVVYGNPYEPVRPSVYFLSGSRQYCLMLRLNPQKSASESVAAIETVVKPHMNETTFGYEFLDTNQATKFGNEKRIGTLASVFAGLAIFISCLGIFGLSSFMAEQRTKEIGLRKVLGASLSQLWLLMSKDFVLLVVLSCVIAAPVAYMLLQSWLEGYQYRVALPWWVFLAATAGTLLITILASSWHMLKAAATNPVNSLKVE